ncbi:hypothetical protein [Pseudobacteriovorax antillogorgiicola]|nr:hypothetical protein [Pseudobacteriovorax antillogorgiicola]
MMTLQMAFDSIKYTTTNAGDASLASEDQALASSGSLLFRDVFACSVTEGGQIELGFSPVEGGI